MAFSVLIDLVPPEHSNLVIGRVVVAGEPDKPDLVKLPGTTALQKQNVQEVLHRCHIIAWKVLCTGIAQQITGATLRDVARTVFKFNDFQANNVSASQIKEFIESGLKSTLIQLQGNVANYYAGIGKPNMSAGGKMGAAIQQLDFLHKTYLRKSAINSAQAALEYKAAATAQQIIMFRNGYDDNPFQTPAEKALARGEYVAFWYQIYYGGEHQSELYAKFLIETPEGQKAIDDLIHNGR